MIQNQSRAFLARSIFSVLHRRRKISQYSYWDVLESAHVLESCKGRKRRFLKTFRFDYVTLIASLGPISFCSYTKQRHTQCIMGQWKLYDSLA